MPLRYLHPLKHLLSGSFWLCAVLLLVGCSQAPAPSTPDFAIPDDPVFILQPTTRSVAVASAKDHQVKGTFPLGRMALDYVLTADKQRLVLPLHDESGDQAAYVAVIDMKTKAIRTIPVPLGAMTQIQLGADGIAYINTGTSDGVHAGYTQALLRYLDSPLSDRHSPEYRLIDAFAQSYMGE